MRFELSFAPPIRPSESKPSPETVLPAKSMRRSPAPRTRGAPTTFFSFAAKPPARSIISSSSFFHVAGTIHAADAAIQLDQAEVPQRSAPVPPCRLLRVVL